MLFSLFTSLTAITINVRTVNTSSEEFRTADDERLVRKIHKCGGFCHSMAAVAHCCNCDSMRLWFWSEQSSFIPGFGHHFHSCTAPGIIGILTLPFAAGGRSVMWKSRTDKFFGVFDWRLASHPAIACSHLLIRNGNYVTWAMAALLLFAPILAQPL